MLPEYIIIETISCCTYERDKTNRWIKRMKKRTKNERKIW